MRLRVQRNPKKPSVLRPLKKRSRILLAGGLGGYRALIEVISVLSCKSVAD